MAEGDINYQEPNNINCQVEDENGVNQRANLSVDVAQSFTRSFSQDGIVTTNYLDNNIVAGKVFTLGLLVNFTATTPIYFTSEILSANQDDISFLFLLPLKIAPTTGYVTAKLYKNTEYTGGTALVAGNRNQNSLLTSLSTIKSGATGTTKGTKLPFDDLAGVEKTNQTAGGGAGIGLNSLIMDKTVRYLYELESSETGLVGITAEFAELRV